MKHFYLALAVACAACSAEHAGDRPDAGLAPDAPLASDAGPLALDAAGSGSGSGTWTATAAGGEIVVTRVAIDTDGTIALAGAFRGSAMLSSVTLTASGGLDGFVATYTADGALRWAHAIGGCGDDALLDVAFDTAHDVVVGGYVTANGSAACAPTLDGLAIAPAGAGSGAELAVLGRFDPAGEPTWVRGYSAGIGSAEISGLALGGAQLAVVGFRSDALDLGGGNVLPATYGSFVAVLDATTGDAAWAQPLDAASMGRVAIDGAHVAVAGTFTGTLATGGGPLTASMLAGFAVGYGRGSGDDEWQLAFASTNNLHAGPIAELADGTYWLGGEFDGTMTVTAGPVTVTGATMVGFNDIGDTDALVAHVGATGTVAISATVGTEGVEDVEDCAAAGGVVAIAGTEDDHGYVARVAADASVLWRRTFASTADTADANAVAVGPSGEVVVAGNDYTGTLPTAIYVARIAP